MLNDELWFKLREIMLEHGIYDKPNLRMIVEAMLYRMRVGCPWRDLPEDFGCWNSIYQQFNRWSSKNKLMHIFKTLVQDPDLEWSFIDGSIVKAHQHSAGLPNKEEQGIGKSVAGNTTKIHMAVDAYGLPIDFEITGGNDATVLCLCSCKSAQWHSLCRSYDTPY
jgi:transposase